MVNSISWLVGVAEMHVVAVLVVSINWSVTQMQFRRAD